MKGLVNAVIAMVSGCFIVVLNFGNLSLMTKSIMVQQFFESQLESHHFVFGFYKNHRQGRAAP